MNYIDREWETSEELVEGGERGYQKYRGESKGMEINNRVADNCIIYHGNRLYNLQCEVSRVGFLVGILSGRQNTS